MSEKPMWRQAVESVDGRMSGRLEQVVRNDNFAIAVGLLLRARRECRNGLSRVTTALLHAVNLPAKRDFDRVVHQLASLEREVLSLRDETHDAGVRRSGGTDEAQPT